MRPGVLQGRVVDGQFVYAAAAVSIMSMVLARPASIPPTPRRDHAPHGFGDAKGPGALEESVCRSEQAGQAEREDEPRAPFLERIGDQHRDDSDETERGERIHESPARHHEIGPYHVTGLSAGWNPISST